MKIKAAKFLKAEPQKLCIQCYFPYILFITASNKDSPDLRDRELDGRHSKLTLRKGEATKSCDYASNPSQCSVKVCGMNEWLSEVPCFIFKDCCDHISQATDFISFPQHSSQSAPCFLSSEEVTLSPSLHIFRVSSRYWVSKKTLYKSLCWI